MRSFTATVNKVAGSSGEVTIETPCVPNGAEVHVISAMAMDLDSDVTTAIEIGIMSGTAKTEVDVTAGTFPKNTSHSVAFPFGLIGGQAVYATFKNATSGDRLRLHVFGKLIQRDCPDEELAEYMKLIDYAGKGW